MKDWPVKVAQVAAGACLLCAGMYIGGTPLTPPSLFPVAIAAPDEGETGEGETGEGTDDTSDAGPIPTDPVSGQPATGHIGNHGLANLPPCPPTPGGGACRPVPVQQTEPHTAHPAAPQAPPSALAAEANPNQPFLDPNYVYSETITPPPMTGPGGPTQPSTLTPPEPEAGGVPHLMPDTSIPVPPITYPDPGQIPHISVTGTPGPAITGQGPVGD